MKNAGIRIILLWLAILILTTFHLSIRETSGLVNLIIVPEIPRQGEPVIATFKLSNPTAQPLTITYQFFANGEVMDEGIAAIAPESQVIHQYAYKNPLQLGERLSFGIRTSSEKGDYEKVISSPPYPPQIWSSFVSFASFSTSMMGVMTQMEYYKNTFTKTGLNIAITIVIVLTTLLIFLELSQFTTVSVLSRLRIRFNTVTWILFFVFMGIIYTKVFMILNT